MGLCSAYAFISYHNRPNTNVFFRILKEKVSRRLDEISASKRAKFRSLSETRIKAKYAISTPNLSENLKFKISGAHKSLNEIQKRINARESNTKWQIRKATKASHLEKIALMMAVYGTLLLFLGALEANGIVSNIYSAIFVCDVVLLASMFVCLFSEYNITILKNRKMKWAWLCKINKLVWTNVRRYLYPSHSRCFLFLVLVILLQAVTLFSDFFKSELPDFSDENNNKDILSFFTVVMLYSCFVVYFVFSQLYCCFKKRQFQHYMSDKKLEGEIETPINQIKDHEAEIDAELKRLGFDDENMPSGFSINQNYTSFQVKSETKAGAYHKAVACYILPDGVLKKIADLGDIAQGEYSRKITIDYSTIREVVLFCDLENEETSAWRFEPTILIEENKNNVYVVYDIGSKGREVNKDDLFQYPQQ